MNMRASTLLLCFACIVPSIFGANILGLFPYPGKSHFNFFRPLFVGLAKAGHDVTVVSHFPSKEHVQNYTDLALDGLPIMEDIIDLEDIERVHFWLRDIKLLTGFFVLNQLGLESCSVAFDSKAIKEVLQSKKKYDIVLTEYFASDCMLAISHKLNAPVIGVTSHVPMPWHYKRMGSPFVPSFMPNHFLGYSDQMGFFERFNNLLHQHFLTFLHELFCEYGTNKLIRKHFGDSVPPVGELVLQTSAMLVNQHYSLNGASPYVPGIVEIGGIHIQEAKPLDPEIKHVLDNAKNGVIYFSWGSLTRPETLPLKKKNALVKALAQFDQLVLIKWPNASMPNPPKNFFVREWMPQRDILCHPNVKVFMTHGGMLGSSEGCHCGVALVVTPFFGDQFHNAEAIRSRNAGVILHFRDLQEDKIVKAVQTALSPRIQESAKFISDVFRNRPQTPMQLAIWWVEHVIRTKGAPLAVNASKRMDWITYNNLDIYAATLIACFLIFKIFKWQGRVACTHQCGVLLIAVMVALTAMIAIAGTNISAVARFL